MTVEYDVMATVGDEWVCVGTFPKMRLAVAAACALEAKGVKARIEHYVIKGTDQ